MGDDLGTGLTQDPEEDGGVSAAATYRPVKGPHPTVETVDVAVLQALWSGFEAEEGAEQTTDVRVLETAGDANVIDAKRVKATQLQVSGQCVEFTGKEGASV